MTTISDLFGALAASADAADPAGRAVAAARLADLAQHAHETEENGIDDPAAIAAATELAAHSDRIVELLGDDSASVRAAAAVICGVLPGLAGQSFEPLAVRAEIEPDPLTRATCLAALGHLSALRSVPVLRLALGDPDPVVRAGAAYALTRYVGDTSAQVTAAIAEFTSHPQLLDGWLWSRSAAADLSQN